MRGIGVWEERGKHGTFGIRVLWVWGLGFRLNAEPLNLNPT